MELYLVKSKREYDHLMNYLEGHGYKWISGTNLSDRNYWKDNMEEMVIEVGDAVRESVSYGSYTFYNQHYPNTEIKRYVIEDDPVSSDDKRVVVPQFIADLYEDISHMSLYQQLSTLLLLTNGKDHRYREWVHSCKGRHSRGELNAQEVLARMHLDDYKVEEKRYYWRKKKEYYLGFEYDYDSNYINLDIDDNRVTFDDSEEIGCFKTKFTETEIMNLVGDEDFDKLERVEIGEMEG